jgi:tRNA modification GTPase
VVVNKIDLTVEESYRTPWPGALPISAATGQGFPLLLLAIREALCGSGPVEDPVLTDRRHVAALDDALAALDRAAGALPLGEELALEDVRDALRALGELTGEFGNDDLYDRIFSTFCIGK